MSERRFSIGVFDSGFGGLTILKEIRQLLPDYNYIYLGDNARAPYGNRSFETVYRYTLQAVERLFAMDCYLIILACNTASAKALRTIQQVDLVRLNTSRRVLGIIRPSVEVLDQYTSTKHIGILGTNGTVRSESYLIEIAKHHPEIVVTQEACPMWVPLVENNEFLSDGADFFIKKHINSLINRDTSIDTLVLGCTHYPLLLPKIRKFLPQNIKIINQGAVVAASLNDYLLRHPEIEQYCAKDGSVGYFTTDDTVQFDFMGSMFLGHNIASNKITL